MPIRSSTASVRGSTPRPGGRTAAGNGSRRERAREHARRDILLASAEVFARRGFAAATLAELAEAAGFAAPSLYRYFESKDEIFRSLVDLVVREMEATFEEPVDASLPLGARLEALLRAQFRIAEAHRAAFHVLHDAGAELPETMRRFRTPHAGFVFYTDRLTGWLRRNASRAELRHPPEVAARAIAGLAYAFGRCPDRAESGGPDHSLIVDLVLEGIAAPAPRRRGAHS